MILQLTIVKFTMRSPDYVDLCQVTQFHDAVTIYCHISRKVHISFVYDSCGWIFCSADLVSTFYSTRIGAGTDLDCRICLQVNQNGSAGIEKCWSLIDRQCYSTQ